VVLADLRLLHMYLFHATVTVIEDASVLMNLC